MTDKILLILDLDETLIFATQNQLDHPPHCLVWPYNIYQRPFFYSFFEKIQTHFDLAIWSSASDEYVEAIVNTVLPKELDLKFAWGRSHCTPLFEQAQEGRYRPDSESGNHLFGRKLEEVHTAFKCSLERTLIVDNAAEKCRDYYDNAICIKEFDGSQDDLELLKLTDYLIRLKDSLNVQVIEKTDWWQTEVVHPYY